MVKTDTGSPTLQARADLVNVRANELVDLIIAGYSLDPEDVVDRVLLLHQAMVEGHARGCTIQQIAAAIGDGAQDAILKRNAQDVARWDLEAAAAEAERRLQELIEAFGRCRKTEPSGDQAA